MGGRIYRSRRGLEVGGVGHAVVLFLSLGDTPGEMVEPVLAVPSSEGSRDFSWLLSGWEGSWLGSGHGSPAF